MPGILEIFADAGDELAAAEEKDYVNTGAVIANFLRKVEDDGGTPAEKVAKLQPLVDAVNDVITNGTTYTGPNATQINLIAQAARQYLPDVSIAEATLRQTFVIRILNGEIVLDMSNEILEVKLAREAVVEANAKVVAAEAKATAAATKVAELEALLRRTKTSITGGLGGEGIRDKAIIAEIKAAV